MNDPTKASDNEETPVPEQGEMNQEVDKPSATESAKPCKRLMRFWLLFILLSGLVVLHTVRDDLRQNAIDSSEQAVHYIAFDMLGWSPRELFI